MMLHLASSKLFDLETKQTDNILFMELQAFKGKTHMFLTLRSSQRRSITINHHDHVQ